MSGVAHEEPCIGFRDFEQAELDSTAGLGRIGWPGESFNLAAELAPGGASPAAKWLFVLGGPKTAKTENL